MKIDPKIKLEFDSLSETFIKNHPKLKTRKVEDLSINKWGPIDNLINSLSTERDRILSNGGVDIIVNLDYSHGYYDSVEFEPTIEYQIEESDLEHQKRLVALKRASDKAKVARKKEKIDQEKAEKELYAKLKAKYEK